MLQFLKKVTRLIFSISLILLIFLAGCERDTPVENVDDGTAPAKPTGLKVFRAYDGEIGIEWTQNLEKDINFYKIFRSQTANTNYFIIDSTTNLYYIDTQLEYDSSYFYKISAVDLSGQESVLSDSVNGNPLNRYSPFPPYYLYINGRNWNDSISVKISFGESYSTDVKYYEIHRSLVNQFTPDSTTIVGETDSLSFVDTKNLELLTNYYYKVIAVDKGNLKSSPSVQLSDIILDSPTQIYPTNNTKLGYFAEFQIQTCSLPADYKIVIQSNEIYGTEVELNFSSDVKNGIISVPIKNVTFNPYSDYYWRIYTYTQNNNVPNSYSELYKFTIVPGG